jgi:hypothetical protein
VIERTYRYEMAAVTINGASKWCTGNGGTSDSRMPDLWGFDI